MTEREWREREELVSTLDIVEEILQIDDLYDEMSSGIADKEIDKTVKLLGKLLRKKETYKFKISLKHTRRQTIVSKFRDRRQERREETILFLEKKCEALKELQRLQAGQQNKQLEYKPEDKQRGLISKIKGIIAKRKERKLLGQAVANESVQSNSPSEAPPEAEQQTPEADVVVDTGEGEVVEDNEIEEQDDIEEDDDVLVF